MSFFRKVGSVLTSGVMLTSTVALAAAASYPAPFVTKAGADVAIVHGGAEAAFTDLVAVTDVASSLSTELAKMTASGSTSAGVNDDVSGEVYALFTGSSPLLLNSSISTVRGTVSSTNLPTVLADSDFSGNVDATITHTIKVGPNARAIFAKQPTSSDDPTVGISVGTTSGNYLYNASISFNKAVNFSHSDSEGEEIELFGQSFTVASATDGTDLVLFKSSETVSLNSVDSPSASVTVAGAEYTIELVSSTDDLARIRVTDSSGGSSTKSINEDDSKTVQGIEVAVTYANEDTARNLIEADLIVGASRIKLTDGEEVKVGTDDDPLDGTYVDFTTNPSAMTEIVVQVYAESGSDDTILPGEAFVDPVFGSFKLNFAGLSISEDDASRETIEVKTSGNDKMSIDVTNWQAKDLTSFEWINNESGNGAAFLGDSSEWQIVTKEMGHINESAYAMVGNEDEGYLVRLRTLSNSSSSTPSDDKVVFENIFDTTQTWEAQITSVEGSGTVSIGGNDYTVTYLDDRDGDNDEGVRLNYPESSGNDMIVYPTVETLKGAKLAFYEPLTIALDNWDGSGSDATGLLFPDGDGYTTITVSAIGDQNGTSFNITEGSGTPAQVGVTAHAETVTTTSVTVGKLTYSVTASGTANQTTLYLQDVDGTDITRPALVLFEEQDDANDYQAIIVQTGGAGTSDNGVGVSDVDFTWNGDVDMESSAYGSSGMQLESDEDLYQMMDIWGTIATTDQSTSDQYTLSISYPDDQVQTSLYVAEEEASITVGGGSSGGATSAKSLGSVSVTDSEVSSVSGKNLVVIGGSCVNSVAADLLGIANPSCGDAFTAATGVGSGQYLIETFSRSSGKVATLVAGYNAGDTTNAAKALTTQSIDTTAGKKYTGTSATSVEAVMTEEATA